MKGNIRSPLLITSIISIMRIMIIIGMSVCNDHTKQGFQTVALGREEGTNVARGWPHTEDPSLLVWQCAQPFDAFCMGPRNGYPDRHQDPTEI